MQQGRAVRCNVALLLAAAAFFFLLPAASGKAPTGAEAAAGWKWWDGVASLDGETLIVEETSPPVAPASSFSAILATIQHLRYLPAVKKRFVAVRVVLELPLSAPDALLQVCQASTALLGIDAVNFHNPYEPPADATAADGDGSGKKRKKKNKQKKRKQRQTEKVAFRTDLAHLRRLFRATPAAAPYLAIPNAERIEPPAGEPPNSIAFAVFTTAGSLIPEDAMLLNTINASGAAVKLVMYSAKDTLAALPHLLLPYDTTVASLCDADDSAGLMLLFAHLAGAMGKRVWLSQCLPPPAEDLAMEGIAQRQAAHASPAAGGDLIRGTWYPTLRLFRSYAALWSAFLTLQPHVAVAKAHRPPRLIAGRMHNLIKAKHGYFTYPRYDLYVGRSLEAYGEWSELEVALFAKLIRKGDWVLDVGANIGTFTVPFAALVGNDGRVLAFEPQRLLFQALNANIALNEIFWAVTRWEGVGDRASTFRAPPLHYAEVNNFGGLSVEKMEEMARKEKDCDGNTAEMDTVPIITIDSLNLSRCDFIKIDVEGMELQVLQGAVDTIRRFLPVLYFENDCDAPGVNRVMEFAAETLGYELRWHITTLYNPDNFFKNPRNLFDVHARTSVQVSSNVLGLHPDAPAAAAAALLSSADLEAMPRMRSKCEKWQEALEERPATEC